MGALSYGIIVSLDGFVEDAEGGITWGAPDEEVAGAVNDLERSVGTYLFGRRMYETMRFWETPPTDDGPVSDEFARLWRGADKVVYSRTLRSVDTARTRLEPRFDPDEVRRLVAALDHDATVGGPALAGQAIAAGLVDELQLWVAPVVLGRGKPWLPRGVPLALELLESRRFASGTVLLRYRPASR